MQVKYNPKEVVPSDFTGLFLFKEGFGVYQNGKLHNLYGPAYMNRVIQMYYRNGKAHKDYGPAVQISIFDKNNPSNSKFYIQNDVITPEPKTTGLEPVVHLKIGTVDQITDWINSKSFADFTVFLVKDGEQSVGVTLWHNSVDGVVSHVQTLGTGGGHASIAKIRSLAYSYPNLSGLPFIFASINPVDTVEMAAKIESDSRADNNSQGKTQMPPVKEQPSSIEQFKDMIIEDTKDGAIRAGVSELVDMVKDGLIKGLSKELGFGNSDMIKTIIAKFLETSVGEACLGMALAASIPLMKHIIPPAYHKYIETLTGELRKRSMERFIRPAIKLFKEPVLRYIKTSLGIEDHQQIRVMADENTGNGEYQSMDLDEAIKEKLGKR